MRRVVSCIKDNRNLENVDVVCMDDSSESIRKRYESFFSKNFRGLQFHDENIVQYLEKVDFRTFNRAREYPRQIFFDGIEMGHNDIFSRPTLKNTNQLNKERIED